MTASRTFPQPPHRSIPLTRIRCCAPQPEQFQTPYVVVFKPEPPERPALLGDGRFYLRPYWGPSGWVCLDFTASPSTGRRSPS
jgi:hypothetical protein